MPFLSIVVPVYNKAKHIEDCVSSILAQRFKDFEIILVDDGSSDDSGRICDRLAGLDLRISVLHQANQGVSKARNAGVAATSGEYIGFVDADDTIHERMYDVLVRNAVDNSACISICRLRENLNIEINEQDFDSAEVLNHDESLKQYFESKLDFSACNKIFSKRIARSIKFEGKMFEDGLYTFEAFLLSDRAVISQGPLYNYFNSENSASVSEFGPKYLDVIRATATIVEMSKVSSAKHLPAAMAMDLVMNLSIVNLILFSGKNKYRMQYESLMKRLKSYRGFVRAYKNLSPKHRAAYHLVICSDSLYFFVLRMYCSLFPSHVGHRV